MEKSKAIAHCTSRECMKNRKMRAEQKSINGVIKTVERNADWCPHCKHALFYTRKAT